LSFNWRLCYHFGNNTQEKDSMADQDQSIEAKVRTLIDQLSAYIEQYHDGSVAFDHIEGDTVYVKLGGACEDCPLSASTLEGWVAGTLRQFFPDMRVERAE
jgi:Fe-S cluster biogenesis protein NfuA